MTDDRREGKDFNVTEDCQFFFQLLVELRSHSMPSMLQLLASFYSQWFIARMMKEISRASFKGALIQQSFKGI